MSELYRQKTEAEARKLETSVGSRRSDAPVFCLNGDKQWVVQHQTGTPQEQLQLTLDNVEMRQAVRIENCQFTYVTVKGKVNSVSIIGCKKVQVTLESVVSSVEIFRCTGMEVQVATSAPTVTIEKSESISLYLLDPVHSRSSDIVTSCASTVNVVFPSEEDGEWIERPIPEQFVSRVVNGAAGAHIIVTKPNLMNL